MTQHTSRGSNSPREKQPSFESKVGATPMPSPDPSYEGRSAEGRGGERRAPSHESHVAKTVAGLIPRLHSRAPREKLGSGAWYTRVSWGLKHHDIASHEELCETNTTQHTLLMQPSLTPFYIIDSKKHFSCLAQTRLRFGDI